MDTEARNLIESLRPSAQIEPEAGQEVPSEEEVVEDVAAESSEAPEEVETEDGEDLSEDEAEEEEDSEDDGEESEEEEDEDSEEDEEPILDQKVETAAGEKTVQELLNFYDRLGGREDALQEKEKAAAETKREYEARSKNLDHLAYTGELSVEHTKLTQDSKQLDEAKAAWEQGKSYGFDSNGNPLQGSTLKDVIDRQESVLKKGKEALHKKRMEMFTTAPGREELMKEAKIDDKNWKEKQEKWVSLAAEVAGYEPEELFAMNDFKAWRLLNRLSEALEAEQSLKSLKKKAKGKDSTASSKPVKGKAATRKDTNVEPTLNEIKAGIAKGSKQAKRNFANFLKS